MSVPSSSGAAFHRGTGRLSKNSAVTCIAFPMNERAVRWGLSNGSRHSLYSPEGGQLSILDGSSFTDVLSSSAISRPTDCLSGVAAPLENAPLENLNAKLPPSHLYEQ